MRQRSAETVRSNTMGKPILVVMAAGMGSRYGGPKQIEPITEHGEILVDFSLYDAMSAGFEDVIFIIKKEIEADVRARVDDGAGRHLNIRYAFQRPDDLPPGYSVPDGRVKPWGTCHAVYAARDLIDGNFAAINADDYYGPDAYRLLFDELESAKDGDKYHYSMVGYRLENTLTEHGHVARGVCRQDADGRLVGVDERLKIMWKDGSIQYTEDDENWHPESKDATVSMNFWGFTLSFLKEIEDGFPAFLDEANRTDPMKAEYLLPRKVDELLKAGAAEVKVLYSQDRWYGITHKEDKEDVISAMRSMKDKGLYPEKLW